MKKPLVVLAFILVKVLIVAVLFCTAYFSRIQTMATIEKHSSYDDYNLYSMTVKYDYDSYNIIKTGFKDTQGFVDAATKEVFPYLPLKMSLPSFGCSAYRAKTTEGETIMGRNYDFRLNTSCMLVRCEPKDGYKSISFAPLSNLGITEADESLYSRLRCLAAPFCILDGVNEKGVSVAVLTLDSSPTDQNTGKEKIATTLALRLVLDFAATTQEAVDILQKYDMYSVNGRDYHFFISDASGDSRVIEYDCESEERSLVAIPMPAITNFYAKYIDKVEPNRKNGIYGHGKERYDRMMEIIEPNNGILSDEKAWTALKSASSAPNPAAITSNTQWSIVFNNTKKTADLTLRRHWDDVFSFAVTEQ